MIGRLIFRPLRDDERGATVIEFAAILLPLCTLIMGGLEVSYRLYATSVANGALREAARQASTGSFTGTQIDNQVKDTIKAFRSDATVTIVKKSYSDFTGVGIPEPVTSGTVASGNYCYQDINGNGSYDADQGKTGLGGAEDVIYYEVTMSYPTLFPLSQKVLNYGTNTVVKLNTMLSNEPYAAVVRTTPATLCVP